MYIGQQRALLLVRWDICRHKVDLGQIELLFCCMGKGEVAAVNRVEGTAKKADIHGQ